MEVRAWYAEDILKEMDLLIKEWKGCELLCAGTYSKIMLVNRLKSIHLIVSFISIFSLQILNSKF